MEIKIQLSKYDNQQQVYRPYLVFEVTREQLVDIPIHQEVHGFYKYEFEIAGVKLTLYSVSPALFDHLPITTDG